MSLKRRGKWWSLTWQGLDILKNKMIGPGIKSSFEVNDGEAKDQVNMTKNTMTNGAREG